MVSEDDGPRGRSAPFPTPALGGHEAENRYSEGARARSAGAADGRAVRQARRPDPKQAARGTERDGPADPRDGSLRNAQPPGGPDPRRPCRRAGTCASQGQGGSGGLGRDRPGLREVRVQQAPVAQAPRRRDRWRTQPLNSVESRRDTIVPKDAGKVSRLRQVRLPETLRYAMLLAALLGLWQIYVTFVGQISLPGPLEVAGALSEGWSDGRLAAATWMTLGTLALGMLIGAMIVVLLSVFAAWIRIGADLLTLLTLMLYPVPAIALLSLLILWFDLVRHESHFTGRGYRLLGHLAHRHQPERRLEERQPHDHAGRAEPGSAGLEDVQRSAPTRSFAARHLRTQSRLGLRLAHRIRRRTRLRRCRRGPTFFTNDAGDFLPAPELLAGLLTIAFAGILVEATFRLLERGTVVRWGMKVGRE